MNKKGEEAKPVPALVLAVIAVAVLVLMYLFLFGPGKEVFFKLFNITPSYEDNPQPAQTDDAIRYNILNDAIEYFAGNSDWLPFYDPEIKLGELIIREDRAFEDLSTQYYFKNSLRDSTLLELTNEERVALLHPQNEIITISQAQATDLFFRYNNVWQWSPGDDIWMTVPETVVTSGNFQGIEPVQANKDLIISLEGKNFEEGIDSLVGIPQFNLLISGPIRSSNVDDRGTITTNLFERIDSGPDKFYGEIKLTINNVMTLEENSQPARINPDDNRYKTIVPKLNAWRDSVFSSPVELHFTQGPSPQHYCVELIDRIQLVVYTSSPVQEDTQC